MAGSKPLGSTAASLLESDEVVPFTAAPSFIALRSHRGKKRCCAMPRPPPSLPSPRTKSLHSFGEAHSGNVHPAGAQEHRAEAAQIN